MGNKSSSRPAAGAEEDHLDQNATITRAISRGKLYISIRHPKSVENVSQKFEDQSYRQILSALQQQNPDLEVILEVVGVDRFCEHITFMNSNDPNKDHTRPRVLIEVLFSGVFSVNKEKIKKTVSDILDPEGECYFDLRCEMGRYHTTTHLETLLRV